MDPILLGHGDGEPIGLGDSRALLKAAAEDTGGRFALIEAVYAPGFPGPLPHRHREMLDCFYVVEGGLRFQLGEETRDMGAGSFVAVPPGTVHTFSNPFDEPARVLNLFTPGGLEGYLREMSALGRPPEPADMASFAARYDFEAADG